MPRRRNKTDYNIPVPDSDVPLYSEEDFGAALYEKDERIDSALLPPPDTLSGTPSCQSRALGKTSVFKITTVPRAQEILDRVLRAASTIKHIDPHPDYRAKKDAIAKVNSISDSISHILERIESEFPSHNNIHPFYYDLIEAEVGWDNLRKSLGAVKWLRERISLLSETTRKHLVRMKSRNTITPMLKEFVGRVSSLVYKLEDRFLFLDEARQRIIHLPVIDTQRPVIIVAGYPNVGKSAFVKAVSSAEPEVASYPFTTKEIVVGHFKKNRQAYQVMDTPGLLDRPLEKRNNIEKKAIAALKNLPGIIVFLVDLSEDCGYSVNHQLSLLDEVRNEFGRERVLPVISKSDLVDNSLHHNKLSKNNEIHAWPQVSINNSESVDKLVGMIVSKLASE